MTFIEYLYRVRNNQNRKMENWRAGQTYFNVLSKYDRNMANDIQNLHGVDCFYVDARIPEFLAYVYTNWNPDLPDIHA